MNSLPSSTLSKDSPCESCKCARQCLCTMMSSRHSTRAFLTTHVSHDTLREVFELAQKSPSNSNVQPWRIEVVTGKTLDRLTSALHAAASSGATPTTKPLPEKFHPYRSALGEQLYGPEGYDIPRHDEERTRNARFRNYRFFDAPCALIASMERGLHPIDVLSVGIYLQSVSLLLAERGIATCFIASVAGYPQVRRTNYPWHLLASRQLMCVR
jgi:nitroreductase